MPKQRLTCTRCSQRRQKCDRKTPCSRCIRNKEPHLCTTQWKEGYNPNVHRRYPRHPSSVGLPGTASSDTSSVLQDSPPGLLQEQAVAPPIDRAASSKTPPSNPITGSGFTIGQSRFLDITIGSLLNEKDTSVSSSHFLDQGLKYVRSVGKQIDEPNRVTSFCSPAAKAVEAQHLQSLIPSKSMVLKITNYYHDNMLYWIGGLYHGPSFRRKLLQAYGASLTLDLQTLDWRWTALLYAILSSSLIASPEALSASWGYTIDEKVRLSREWGAASFTCLNFGNYTSQYHICSIQTIYVLHAYEHLVGSTNQWVAMRSVAVVIAKGLGLHKLSEHPDDHPSAQLTPDQKEALIEREIGRRTWMTIATQEWLCSATHSSYMSTIQRRQFTSVMPRHVDEETMQPIDDNTPCFTLVGCYLFDYAKLLLDFHNSMLCVMDADDVTRYAIILKYDGELRATGVEKTPKVLSTRTRFNPAWPKWTKWARNLHQASINHKIIMMHQSFLNKSFKDARYTYTRWACATASKSIINSYSTRDADEPQWWVEQAFVVTASLCLLLDLFHRPSDDADVEEYLASIQQSIRFLQQFFTSSVAIHGVRLLYSLLQEYNKSHESTRPPAAPGRPCGCMSTSMGNESTIGNLRMSHNQCLPANPEVPLSMEEAAQFNFDIDSIAFEDLADWLPMEGGLDNNVLMDSIYGLANGQF